LYKLKDRELKLQTLARENHVKQLAEVEKSYQEAVKQANDVLALLDQVERNGKYKGILREFISKLIKPVDKLQASSISGKDWSI